MEIKPCPFCGEKIKAVYPHLTHIEMQKKWCLTHNCPHQGRRLNVCIAIYGDTQEDVIERWNNRAKVKKSKST